MNMNKSTILLFTLALVLLSLSFSSALCLNCNQLNPQVKYYQDSNGCNMYSIAQTYQVYNVKPVYSINQPYSMYSMVQYHQNYLKYDQNEKEELNSQESKCNWHMLFYRSC